MKFGLFGGAKSTGGAVDDSQTYGKFIDYVLFADEVGYASVFLVEHHFTGVGQISASLNLLTYLAARTTRMRLGTAVVVLPWHNQIPLGRAGGLRSTCFPTGGSISASAKATGIRSSRASAF
jgi:alkanesulfonate monooxygenase SsuD/methylene tetrahydromethanopterin reductase-like flavin-dependent oxidoreductase (luciferase family)